MEEGRLVGASGSSGFRMGYFDAQGRRLFCDAFERVEIGRVFVRNDVIKGGEVAGMVGKEGVQRLLKGGRGGIGVNADRPKAGLLRYGLPELLGNPEDFVARDGPAREPVGQDVETLLFQGAERVAVEAVTRRDKEAGI